MIEAYVKTLRERGVGVTPQHVGVRRLLAGSGGHFTPEEVWERMRADLPGMELSTVYRVLEALRRVGLVVESGLRREPGYSRPDPRSTRTSFASGAMG